MTRLPHAFRAPAALQRLNVVAAAASLAAATGAALTNMSMLEHTSLDSPGSSGAASAASTFFYALVWARLLRSRGSLWRWLWSVPLAAVNAGTALALSGVVGSPLAGLVLGATFGVLIWGPALVLTLVCFGLPIHFARRAAEHGLSSEDRGERTVGLVALAIGALALAYLSAVEKTPLDLRVVAAAGVLAILTGGASAGVAHLRERSRRQFVTGVRNGKTAGYRLETDTVVVRVTEQGHAYRASTLTEPVVVLDESGDTKHLVANE